LVRLDGELDRNLVADDRLPFSSVLPKVIPKSRRSNSARPQNP